VSDRHRRRTWFAVGLCGAALIAIIVLGVVLSENVVYFRTVSEAVQQGPSQGSDRFRLAGAVVAGSVRETRDGVRFEVTDGKATVAVAHRGDPPDLFKAGAPVVCEGQWGKGRTFDSDRIMIRHGNEYRPPKVDAHKAPDAA
jgi:cytochrome c-type biogenesis protein CcmE